ncbi:MAG: hypothetical protein ACTSU2_16760 [Promethearchaeota archaeon]
MSFIPIYIFSANNSNSNSKNFTNVVTVNNNLFSNTNKLHSSGNASINAPTSVNISVSEQYYNENLSAGNLEPNNLTLNLNTPNSNNYDLSYINVTIGSINAPNISREVSPLYKRDWSPINSTPSVTSFHIDSGQYLSNASFYLNVTGAASISVYIYNSTWNASSGLSEPGPVGNAIALNTTVPLAQGVGWYTILCGDYFLNNSKTDNNTWFIALALEPGSPIYWGYEVDGLDNSTSYGYNSSNWILIRDNGATVDLSSKLSFNSSLEIAPEPFYTREKKYIPTFPLLASFTLNSNCYLKDATFYLNVTGSATLVLYLYNATWNGTSGLSVPEGLSSGVQLNSSVSLSSGAGTYTINAGNYYLNNSKTENNTWFIGLVLDSGSPVYWQYEEDGPDNTTSYEYNSGWQLVKSSGGENVDFGLEIMLTAQNGDKVLPSNINLQINGTAVQDILNDPNKVGDWSINSTLTPLNYTAGKEIELLFDLDYPMANWTIINVTAYYILNDSSDSIQINTSNLGTITWLVNKKVAILDNASRNFQNLSINLTVPNKWIFVQCYDMVASNQYNVIEHSLGNGFKDVSIVGSHNSANWVLEFNTPNIFLTYSVLNLNHSNINTSSAHYSDDLDFLVTSSQNITGTINLSISDPQDSTIFYLSITSITPQNVFDFPSYDLSDNITIYGIYKMEVIWFNSTDCGYIEQDIIILGETSLSLVEPPLNYPFKSDESFNLTVFFEDSGKSLPITNAQFYYRINNEEYKLSPNSNNSAGYYSLSIDCNVLDKGVNVIYISLNKSFYDNQTFEYTFTVNAYTENDHNQIDWKQYIIYIIIISAIVITIFIIRHQKKKRKSIGPGDSGNIENTTTQAESEGEDT